MVVVVVGDCGGDGSDGAVDERSVDDPSRMHLIMVTMSLWTWPLALHLCAGPKKLTPISTVSHSRETNTEPRDRSATRAHISYPLPNARCPRCNGHIRQ